MAKSWKDETEMEEVYRQLYEDFDYDETREDEEDLGMVVDEKIKERERRKQEKEDERYQQVMREADEDLCVPMVTTKRQEQERDQRRYRQVLIEADEDMCIPIVTGRSQATDEEQYHQILKEADEDLCVPTATPKDHKIRLSFGIHPRFFLLKSTTTLDTFFKN
ncbi:unnamed protein product [Mytilus coruscus]|uniref:Uncharacterized protein n=1 Tax=Mytilus coruscus TaxID=42192 RepID=A0A6J8C2S6_MYTCO|nr:unnamed protein product [Mytilus coruscus]